MALSGTRIGNPLLYPMGYGSYGSVYKELLQGTLRRGHNIKQVRKVSFTPSAAQASRLVGPCPGDPCIDRAAGSRFCKKAGMEYFANLCPGCGANLEDD